MANYSNYWKFSTVLEFLSRLHKIHAFIYIYVSLFITYKINNNGGYEIICICNSDLELHILF